MVMADEDFGHRDSITGTPKGDRTKWIDWDFALDQAFHIIEAYTDQDGIYEWQKRDPAQGIDAKRKVNAFHAAKDRITNAKNYKPQPGEYFVPDMKSVRADESLWTYQEWREDEMKKAKEKAEADNSDKLE